MENATYSWGLATNMKMLFDSESTTSLDKADALRSAIIAAVGKNRYASMDTCKVMIVRAEDAELGQRVHEILIEHDAHFIRHIDPAECRSPAVRAAVINLKAPEDARIAAGNDDFPNAPAELVEPPLGEAPCR